MKNSKQHSKTSYNFNSFSKKNSLDERIQTNKNIYSAVVTQQELAKKYSLVGNGRSNSETRQLNLRGRRTLAQKLGMQEESPPIDWQTIISIADERGYFYSHCSICMDRYFPPNKRRKERKVCILSCGHVFHHNCIYNFEKFTKEAQENELSMLRGHSYNNTHTSITSNRLVQGAQRPFNQRSTFNQFSMQENTPKISVVHRCPYCRKEDYEKENITQIVFEKIKIWAATEIQRIWRSFTSWKEYRELRFKKYPEERKKYISNRLVSLASKLEHHTIKRTMDIDKFLEDLDKSVQQSRLVMMNHNDWDSIMFDAKLKLNNEEELIDCAICMCPIELKTKSAVVTSCKHLFHQKCIESFEIFTKSSSNNGLCSCPLCRSPFLKKILE